ncbi:hypothetical protein ASE61_19430 [Bosea sp. Root670]|nr:hypothetical protein ASE61_19430 [Bosea sp. Root670]
MLVFGLVIGGLSVMFFTWLCAELVSRPFRLALPSIVLLIGFSAGAFFASSGLLDPLVKQIAQEPTALTASLNSHQALRTGGGLIFAAFFVGLYYWRFRVPLAVSVASALFFIGAFSLLFYQSTEATNRWALPITLSFGLVMVALAVRYDLTDPSRATRRSDVAYWLYLLAGVAGSQAILGGLESEPATSVHMIGLSVLLLLFGVIGLVLERNILFSATILSSGLSVAYSAWRSADSGQSSPLLWLLLAALGILGSAVCWRPLRLAVVPRLPLGRLADKLPPIQPEKTRACP